MAMRKIFVFLTLSVMGAAAVVSCSDDDSVQASVQDTMDESLLVEGKRWNYTWRSDSHLSIFVKGDTIVNGKACKKLYRQEEGEKASLYMVLYEEDGKIYTTTYYPHYPENGTLLYNFGLQIGDSLEITMASNKEEWHVTDTLTSTVCGHKYRILHLEAPSGYKVTWISGVGNYYMSLHNSYHLLSERAHLVSVEVGGRTIFTEEEYLKNVSQ